MPTPRDPDRGSLSMAVLHVLAHGDLPVERVPGTGRVAAFEFKHYSGRPGVVAEMRRIWREYRDEIVAATPLERMPWIQRVLEAPETLDENDETGNDEARER